MNMSSKIQEKILECLSDEKEHSVQNIKKYLANEKLDDYTEGQFAGSVNTLLRNKSIKKVDRGVYVIKRRAENMRKCFIICPIGEEGSATRKNADSLFNHIIVPVCEECDFTPIRVDKLNDVNSITQTIIDYLENSELVIADISGHNPNVFYEMGYRARTKKPIIHLRNKGEKIPFDVNTIRTLDYDLTDLDSVVELKKRLIKTINSFNYSEYSETEESDEFAEIAAPAIMPVLYQILDSIGDIKNEIKTINVNTIGAVIEGMQKAKPKFYSDSSLQSQLVERFMENPEEFVKIAKMYESWKKDKK